MSLSAACLRGLVALLAAVGPLAALESTEQLTPAAATAVKRAVDWLGKTQSPDGSWKGGRGNTTGVVAAAAIALMSQGHLPGVGEYGPQTAKAIQFLMRNAQQDGLIYRQEMGPFPMYHHALATLALAEAWGQSSDPKLREALRKAVDLICSAQNRQGGWRYQPQPQDADLSATVMQLMALRAARDAGLEVPGEVIDQGIGYVKNCQNPKGKGKDGGFAYQPGGESGFARAGAGVTSLQVAGDYRASEVTEGIEYILTFKPLGEKKYEQQEFYHYGLYYCTMGLYQAQSLGATGRRWWGQWYPAVMKDLVARQEPDGRWKSNMDVYDTAMGVLILTIPYRYLPIYQR